MSGGSPPEAVVRICVCRTTCCCFIPNVPTACRNQPRVNLLSKTAARGNGQAK